MKAIELFFTNVFKFYENVFPLTSRRNIRDFDSTRILIRALLFHQSASGSQDLSGAPSGNPVFCDEYNVAVLASGHVLESSLRLVVLRFGALLVGPTKILKTCFAFRGDCS